MYFLALMLAAIGIGRLVKTRVNYMWAALVFAVLWVLGVYLFQYESGWPGLFAPSSIVAMVMIVCGSALGFALGKVWAAKLDKQAPPSTTKEEVINHHHHP